MHNGRIASSRFHVLWPSIVAVMLCVFSSLAGLVSADTGLPGLSGKIPTVYLEDAPAQPAAAGTEILNIALLTYVDNVSGELIEVESNTSRLVVVELRRFSLGVAGRLERLAGADVSFAHRLENVGNVDDTYRLSVLDALADSGELIDLTLTLDRNGNGLADSDEPEIDGPIALAPGETADLVVTARVPEEATPGDMLEIVVTAASGDSTLAEQSIADVVVVLDRARLEVAWGEARECAAGVSVGDRIALTLAARNLSDTLPAEQALIVDGEMRSGVLVEAAIPDGFSLSSGELLDVVAFRAVVLVQASDQGASWMRHSAWNGQSPVDRVALLVPASGFARDEMVGFGFDVVAEPTTSIDEQGFVASVSDGGTARSEIALLECTVVGRPQASVPASIRFLKPTLALQRAGSAPQFERDGDFVDSALYRLDTGSGDYRLSRDGVYVELTADFSASQLYLSGDGTAHVAVTVASSVSGQEMELLLRETLPGSSVYRSVSPIVLTDSLESSGSRCPADFAQALEGSIDYTAEREICVLSSSVEDSLSVSFVDPVYAIDVSDLAMVDPVGHVFDSTTLAPITGAIITVYANGRIATDPLTDEPLSLVTDKQGRYVLPRLPAGTFHLDVRPPPTHRFPSSVPAERFTTFQVSEASYGRTGHLGEGFGEFTIVEGDATPVIDIPLDALGRDLLMVLEKQAVQESVSPGEDVTYSILVGNRSESALRDLVVIDTPPFGFRYVSGSARVGGERIPNPERIQPGSAERNALTGLQAPRRVTSLRFSLGDLPAGEERTLAYELQATAGALDSDGVNTAMATALGESGVLIATSPSRAQVDVSNTGVLSDLAMLFGKVYVDSTCDGIQNRSEVPVGGVRLYLQDGTFVVTDEDGQFSLYGLRTGLHVLKLDPLTLPEGLLLKPTDTRNAADPRSRFVELSRGDFHRVDFAAVCPAEDPEAVLEALLERNQDLRGVWLLDEAARFDPDAPGGVASDQQRADADGDLSNGLLGVPRVSGTAGASADKDAGAAAQAPAAIDLSVDGESSDAERSEGSTAGTPSPSGLPNEMGDPKVLAASITAEQAKTGTWLWPAGELSSDGRFMAVVRSDVEPTLYVGDVAVPASQIGERIVNRREQAQIVAWYGVKLVPGVNRVEVRGTDGFGNERVLAGADFKRPAAGVRMVLRTRKDTMPADGGRTMLPVDILITDANGLAASGVYFVTLDTTAGSFLEKDLQSFEPGIQIRVENGRGKIHVRSSDLSGRMRVTARAGGLEASLNLMQIAAARPLVGVGLVEIGGRFGQASRGNDERADLEEGFDVNARAAVFLKGRVRGNNTLTLAYDTDKDRDTGLLRDNNPNENYPTHGDASVRGFEAQSRSRLYAKLERDRNSIMWGDYLTDAHADADDLARTQRTLTGLNAVYDSRRTRGQAFVAMQTEVRGSEEVRGNGTAMLFRIEGAPLVVNSEVVERIVRDRDNPGIVLESERLIRFVDYTLDAVTGLMTFSDAVPSVDADLNPVFVRVSYDRAGDFDEHVVAGLRLQRLIGETVRVGASLTRDTNPLNGNTLAGMTMSAQPSPNTRVMTSVAAQRHEDGRESGGAVRVQLEHEWGGRRDFRTLMSWARSDATFDNPSAGVAAGRKEWRVEHHQPLNNTLKALATAIGSHSTVDGTGYGSVGATLEKSFRDWSLSAGSRYVWSDDGTDRIGFQTLSLGVERRFDVFGRQVSIGADYERDIADAQRFRYALDSRVQLFPHLTLYGRYERERGLSAQSLLGETSGSRQLVAGIESDILPSTQVYSEYRLRGTFGGMATEAASGARGRYEIEPGLSVSPAFEVIDALDGDAQNSVAVSVGVSDTRNPNRKLSGQGELRETEDSRYRGLRASLAQRLNVDWTALIREDYTRQAPDVGELTSRHRLTVGLARRPKLDNRHHMLVLANWKQDYGPEDGQDRRTYLLSNHHNLQLGKHWTLSGRVGAKWLATRYVSGTRESRAYLFDVRSTVDIARRFEVDLRAGALAAGGFGDGRYSAGAGVSWIVDRNLRLGMSYNVMGFRDDDLDEQAYNARGLSFGLQLKFDEDAFQWLEE